MSSTNKPIWHAWIPALVWLVVIALESTSLGASAKTQSLLLSILRFFAPQISSTEIQLINDVGRKIGHCFGYAMLSLLMLRAWWTTLLLLLAYLRGGASRKTTADEREQPRDEVLGLSVG